MDMFSTRFLYIPWTVVTAGCHVTRSVAANSVALQV